MSNGGLMVGPEDMICLIGLKEVELYLLRKQVQALQVKTSPPPAPPEPTQETSDGRDDPIPQNLS